MHGIGQTVGNDSWPWYITGPLIGLVVALLMLIGNRSFGVSTVYRHVLAAIPGNPIRYFRYPWKQELWNLVFAAGMVAGGALVSVLFTETLRADISPFTTRALREMGLGLQDPFLPDELFSIQALQTWKGWVFTLGAGMVMGFGARWAGGCTSGHTITGLATLQLPSVIATCSFLAGGYIAAMVLLPWLLSI
jgi:uncharacterized protein